MPEDLIATTQDLGQASGGNESLSSLYREIGLAAVAKGLNLQLNTLAPERLPLTWPRPSSAGASFSPGRRPSLTRFPSSIRAGEQGGLRRTRYMASKATAPSVWRREKLRLRNGWRTAAAASRRAG